MDFKKLLNRLLEIRFLDYSLIIGGAFYMFFAIFALIKFINIILFLLMPLVYALSMIIIGLTLVGSSLRYAYYARRFSNGVGYACGITAIIAGIGYIFLGNFVFQLISNTYDIDILGIAITFIRTGLFFYGFLSLFFFSERPQSQIGTIGSIAILLFGASFHMFVFSAEFFTAAPGALVSIVAGAGFTAQGVAMLRLRKPIKYEYPKENVRII